MVLATDVPATTGSSETQHAVAPSRSADACASAAASRVLPIPPGPVSVSSRVGVSVSRSTASDSSAARPTISLVGAGGRTHCRSGSDGPAATSRKVARACSSRPRASASSRAVSGRGARRRPRSRAAIASTLRPASRASSSWDRPLARRCRRKREPNSGASRAAELSGVCPDTTRFFPSPPYHCPHAPHATVIRDLGLVSRHPPVARQWRDGRPRARRPGRRTGRRRRTARRSPAPVSPRAAGQPERVRRRGRQRRSG